MVKKIEKEESSIESLLQNKKVIVRHINKPFMNINDTNHALYGGMGEMSTKTFTLPLQKNGEFKQIFTKEEQNWLEDRLGYEENFLSFYKKNDNFWDTFFVTLYKEDMYLDLSSPLDLIKYRVLLANDSVIAKSLDDIQDRPKQTYLFYITPVGQESAKSAKKASALMEAAQLLGKYQDNFDILKLIVETCEAKTYAPNVSLDFLKGKATDLVTANAKEFIKVATDNLLEDKVFIKKCIEAGLISNRGGMLYLREDNQPLCEHNEDPVLSKAALFINNPKHQDIRMSLETKLKK